ncbi:MAG: deoxynucleoside kinase, partial [Aureispira sp.]|nr:deoxynucleoside kinase [Aureispira sp.]
KTLLFAGQNLVDEELRLFQRLFHTLNASFPKPHLLVYLHRSVDDLLANISQRGRDYEKDISAAYLLKIQQAYFDFFRMTENDLSILILDVEGLDFINNTGHYQIVIEQLQKKYPKGLHHWSLK